MTLRQVLTNRIRLIYFVNYVCKKINVIASKIFLFKFYREFSSVLIGKGLVSKKPKHSLKTPTKKQSVMNLEPDSDSKRIESQFKNEPIKISTRKQIIYSNFTS